MHVLNFLVHFKYMYSCQMIFLVRYIKNTAK